MDYCDGGGVSIDFGSQLPNCNDPIRNIDFKTLARTLARTFVRTHDLELRKTRNVRSFCFY